MAQEAHINEIATHIPVLLGDSHATVTPRTPGATPYLEPLLESARAIAAAPESEDPLAGLKKKDVKINPTAAGDTLRAQLGDLSGTAPAEPVRVAPGYAEYQASKTLLTALVKLESPEKFATLPATEKNVVLDQVVTYLDANYDAYKALFVGKNAAQKRALVEGMAKDPEVIKKMRAKLNEVLQQPSAWQAEEEKRRANDEKVRNAKRISVEVAHILFDAEATPRAMAARSPLIRLMDFSRVNFDDIKVETVEDFANLPVIKLRELRVPPGFPAGYPAPPATVMVGDIFQARAEAEFSAWSAAHPPARAGAPTPAEVERHNQARVAIEGKYAQQQETLFRQLKEIKELHEQTKAKEREVQERRSAFKTKVGSAVGEAVGEVVDERVSKVDAKLRETYAEAKTKDEAIVQGFVEKIDRAWKTKKTTKEGDIWKLDRKARKKVGKYVWALLDRDTTPEAFMRNMVTNMARSGDITRAEAEAYTRLIAEDPTSEALKELQEKASLFVLRDYHRTGGTISEKKLERLVAAKQDVLVNLIKESVRITPETERSLKEVLGEEAYKELVGDKKSGKNWEAFRKTFLTRKTLGVAVAIALAGVTGYFVWDAFGPAITAAAANVRDAAVGWWTTSNIAPPQVAEKAVTWAQSVNPAATAAATQISPDTAGAAVIAAGAVGATAVGVKKFSEARR